LLDGFCGDSCYTFCVGEVKPEIKKLLDVTKQSLYKGIEQSVIGHRIGDIGSAVQREAETNGYGVVRELVGHGIGKEMHEEPHVPNYGNCGTGEMLKNGMCIAIEPMITQYSRQICMNADKWTILTRDGGMAAHYEHTIAIRKSGPDILSSFEFLEDVLRRKRI
jgi:methionyl aminopeptidase